MSLKSIHIACKIWEAGKLMPLLLPLVPERGISQRSFDVSSEHAPEASCEVVALVKLVGRTDQAEILVTPNRHFRLLLG